MTVHPRVIGEHHDIAQRHALHPHMAVAGTNQSPACQQHISGTRFLHLDGATFIQPAGKHVGESFGHVLHHHDGAGEIRRQLRQQVLQRVGPSGGNADGHHPRGGSASARQGFRWPLLFARRGGQLRRDRSHAGMRRYFDLADQLGGDLFHLRLSGVARLGDEIKCAQRQRFESGRGAGGGVRAYDDDRQLVSAGDLPQSFHAVHARHVEIESDHVRLEFFDLAQGKAAVNGRPYHFDGLVALQDLRNHLAHERGVIYY